MCSDATREPSHTHSGSPSSIPTKRKPGFFASEWGSFLLAFASVFSAAFISVCSGPILTELGNLGNLNFKEGFTHTLGALALSVIALWMVYRRERALSAITEDKERQNEEMQKDLSRQNKEMEGRLTYLPPRQFIQEYVETQANIGQLRRAAKTDPDITREIVAEHMRSMLDSILALTRLWDGVSTTNKRVAYQANIMSVFSSDEVQLDSVVLPRQPTDKEESHEEEVDPQTPEGAEQTTPSTAEGEAGAQPQAQAQASAATSQTSRPLRFTREVWNMHDHFFLHNQSHEVALQRCSGILFLEDELVTTSSNDKPAKSGFEQACLPYTLNESFKPEYHHPNLPGAPRVAASRQPEYISDTAHVVTTWVTGQRQDVREFNGRYEQKICDYYRDLTHAKSILSMPVFHGEDLIGVLNVSRNAKDMLPNADRADQFAQFMVPVCYHLGKMLALLKTTRDS
ncbi:hypothetical protein IR012_00430 [Pseudomonas putida]|uniref:hypothetical protein n=1 Tax=Pseudomonas putida TaxID=303 RepID=UPI0018AAD539|nr:hypothetical protein [Pseudomonas putida]MBF8668390.1 hypothetical protein [Pseudomonas putida]MBF8710791.1 hypothetical protein [Pseudomonas putida]